MLAYVPGPVAPVPTGPVAFDAGAALAILTGLVVLSGAAVLLAAAVDRARRWCAERARHASAPLSQPA